MSDAELGRRAQRECADEAATTELAGAPPKQIPSLEPPLPLLDEWRLRRRLSRQLKEQLKTTPSWLISLVAHLTVFLVLALLIRPMTRHSRLESLIFTADQSTEVVNFEPTLVEVEFEQPEVAAPTPTQLPSESAEEQLDAVIQDQDAPVTDELTPTFDAPLDQPLPVRAEHVENLNVVLANALRGVVPDRRLWSVAQNRRIVNSPKIMTNPRVDQIVDDFILFDVGKLRGRAGQNARQRFDRLGPEAIPSLVKGLNKSAYIHASCPVGVISSRLKTKLRESDDPRMLEYVLENLGRDVDKSAPHASRIRSLRKSLARGDGADVIAMHCKSLGVEPSSDLVRRITSLSKSRRNVRPILAAISDNDEFNRVAGIVAAFGRGKHASKADFIEIGETLSTLIARESNPEIRRIVHLTACHLTSRRDLPATRDAAEAWRQEFYYAAHFEEAKIADARTIVRALSRKDEFVTRPTLDGFRDNRQHFSVEETIDIGRCLLQHLDSDDDESIYYAKASLVRLANEDVGKSSADWAEYWDRYDIEKLYEPKARAQLRSAEALQQRGRRRSAVTRYRRIAAEYPETSSGQEANRRWLRLTGGTADDRELLLRSD